MTHPENDPIFIDKPPAELVERPPKVRRAVRERKLKNLMALSESLPTLQNRLILKGIGNCHE